MSWREYADAAWLPLKACFELSAPERRLLLGLLLLFLLGLAARQLHLHASSAPSTPPTEELIPYE